MMADTNTMSTRVAVITGSAQGIGKAIALRLAKDGLNIVVGDIPTKLGQLEQVVQEIQALGVKALAVPCDVAVEREVEGLVNAAVAEFGSLDVMVANAGVALVAQLLSMTEKEWDFVNSINIKGVFFCYKAAAAQMVKQGRGGRIIGASSLAGKTGITTNGAYCASKFAVRGLTQCAALELAAHKITVNAYAPGLIQTSMRLCFVPRAPTITDVRAAEGVIKSLADQGLETQVKALQNMPSGSPDDVAALVSFIASQESQFITGQALNINGGIYFD